MPAVSRRAGSDRLTLAILVVGLALVALTAGTALAQTTVLTETRQIRAADRAWSDQFGSSLALGGGLLVTGAPGDDDLGSGSGSAYVYDVLTGGQVRKFTSADGQSGDSFGLDVAIGGQLALISAPYDDDDGSRSGAAYVFDLTTGAQVRKLTAADAMGGDNFGYSVAADEDLGVVGAWTDQVDGVKSGSAYLYNMATGEELFKLTPDDGTAGDYFGGSCAIGGGRVVVGAFGNDQAGDYAGAAYVYDAATGQQLHKLVASDGAAQDRFGVDVATDGVVAIVSAHENDSFTGAAYVFDLETGAELFKLTPSDAAPGRSFGVGLGISGHLAVIGAYDDDLNHGSAYVFDLTTGEELFKLIASDPVPGDFLGQFAAIDGDWVVLGAHGDDAGSGIIYTYQVPEPTTLALLAMGAAAMIRRRRD